MTAPQEEIDPTSVLQRSTPTAEDRGAMGGILRAMGDSLAAMGDSLAFYPRFWPPFSPP